MKTQHHQLGPVQQDQRTFFKAGILNNRPPDSDVIFEPQAVSIYLQFAEKHSCLSYKEAGEVGIRLNEICEQY